MKIFQFILGVVFLTFSQKIHPETAIANSTETNLIATAEITSVSPAVNTITAPPNSNIVLSFTSTIDAAVVNANTIVIRGNQTGIIPGTFSGGGTNTITFDPTTDFAPGEIITVTITDAVAVSYTYQFTVRVSAALGTNSISNVQQTITTNADGARTLYAVDLNNDGDIDVLSASDDDDRIAWYENSGGGFGNPATNQNTISTSAIGAFSTVAADIDGDGDLDVLSASFSDDRIAWYENLGNGNFGDPATNQNTISTMADGATSVHAADLDNDGHIDVIANSNNDVVWYKNLGNGDFGDPATNQRFIHDSPVSILVSSVYAADFNNDGLLDVVSGSFIGNTIAWYQNLGNGDFGDPTANQNTVFTNVNGVTSVYAADMDNDGAIDILSSSRNDNRIVFYRNFNNGNFGTFTNISTIAAGAESVYAADMDGDGDLDALSASSADDRIAWYENVINGFFGDPATNQITISTAANGAQDVYTVDVDNDGDLDVLSASNVDNRIAWYENPSAPTIPVFLSVSSTTGNETDATLITVTATADSPVSGDQTVDLGVSGTNITAGDFALSSTTITIADGQTTGSATFTIVDDAIFEGEETATLTISNPSLQLVIDGPTQDITIIDSELGETQVTLDSSGNLSITDINGGNSDDTITLTLVNGDTELNIHNTVNNISISGSEVVFVDINNVRVPLAAITGDITINTLEGTDTITLNAELNLVANQSLTILGASTITQNSNLSYSNGMIAYQAADAIMVNAASWTSSESGTTTLLSEGDIMINGNIELDAATLGGDINLVAGWDGITPFDALVFDAFDTGDELAGITPFGNNNGSVRIGNGTQTEAIRVGSRSGANRVYGYDLVMLRNQGLPSSRFVQLGVGGAGSNLDVTGSISVRVRHDIELVQARIGHGGTADALISIAAGNNLNFRNPGSAFFTVSRLGHLVDDNDSNETASGNITIFHANDILLTTSSIGHGGDDFEGTLSGDITIHKAHDLIFNDFSQLGHGGFRQDRTDNMGNITLMDVNDINLAGQLTGNDIGRGPRLGHGGYRANGRHTGDIHIVKANDINLTGGGALLAIAQIGHGTIDDTESFPDGRERTGNHIGDILIDEVQNITLTGGTGVMAFTQIGHGGANFNRPTQQSIGFLNGIVTINASGEISLIDGNNAVTNGNFAWLGHASAAHTDGLDGTQADVGNPFDFFTTDNGDENITITARAMDNATAVVPSGGVGTVRGDWMQYSMRGGNVLLKITDASLITTGGDVDLDGFIEGQQTLPADATHGLTIMTSHNLIVNHAIQSQNPNTGNSLPINLIAGWDGSTPFDATTFDAVNVNAASPTLFGNNGGSVSIADGSQPFGVTIGSRSAATRVYGHNLTITGGADNAVFAQLGFQISNAGEAYMVTGPLSANLRNNIAITSGAATDAYAMLGHIGTDQIDDATIEATVDAPITISLGNNLNVTANGTVAFGQIGHGGTDALGNYNGNITINTVNDLNFTSGDVILAYTQLGHGGVKANGTHIGDIKITTANNLNFTGGDALASYSQLGHGGHNTNAPIYRGEINITNATNIMLLGGDASSSYSQIGHGSANYGNSSQSDSNIQGAISINATGEISMVDGNTPNTNNNYSWIGHAIKNAAILSIDAAPITVTTARLDNSSNILASGGQGTIYTEWLQNALNGGDVSLIVTHAGLNLEAQRPALGITPINNPFLGTNRLFLVSVHNDLVFNPNFEFDNAEHADLVFAAGNNFHNDSGSNTPLTDTDGRWLIYSTNPDLNRQDIEIDHDFIRFEQTFNPLDPFPLGLPSGNGLLYSDPVSDPCLLEIIYVDANATTGNNDGSSWADAFTTLQPALDLAVCTNVTEIRVASGTYLPTESPDEVSTDPRDLAFHVDEDIIIKGSYIPDNDTNANNDVQDYSDPSILSGDLGVVNDASDNAYHVLITANLSTASLLDGFTIIEGNANGGLTTIGFSNLVFVRNSGGGMFNHTTALQITNSNFNENTATEGGGVYNLTATPSISNATFKENTATLGAGMYNRNSASAVTNTIFSNNSATDSGGALTNFASSPTIINTTFYENSADNSGGGMSNESTSNPILYNTVFFNNTGADISGDAIDTNSSHNASDGTGGAINSGTNFINLNGIAANTIFENDTDADGTDNQLGTADDGLLPALGSPLVDAGDDAQNSLATDVSGQARIINSIDIGAHERTVCVGLEPIIYVDVAATGNADGSSWEDAFTDLQSALDLATCVNITEIRVASGTYYPTESPNFNGASADTRDRAFHLDKNIVLRGSYNSVTDMQDYTNPSILSGDFNNNDEITGSGSTLSINRNTENAYHVFITANLNTTTIIDGFTLTGGSATTDVVSSISYSGRSFARRSGGGIYNVSSSPIINNITIYGNSSSAGGAGMLNSSSSPIITNCIFDRNISGQSGGGMFNGSSSPKITNSIFIGNAATGGGAISNSSSSSSIAHTNFIGNSGVNSGSVMNNSSASITRLYNSVIYGNEDSPSDEINDLHSSSANNASDITDDNLAMGANFVLLTQDPFNNIDNPNGADNIWGTTDDGLVPMPNSMLIDAGDNNLIPFGITTDIKGQNRILNNTVDIGAYEILNPCELFTDGIVYVDVAATGNNDGSAWANAYTNLQEALDVVICPEVTEIRVASGTYLPTESPDDNSNSITNRNNAFHLDQDVILKGSYNPANGLQHYSNPSILSGDFSSNDIVTGSGNTLSITNNSENAYHVFVTANLSSATLIDGFTITKGNANEVDDDAGILYNGVVIRPANGAGMFFSSSSPTITNVGFSESNAIGGTAILLLSSSPILSNIVINKNRGSAMTNDSSNPIITNAVFTGNFLEAVSSGAAMSNFRSSVTIVNSTFSENASNGFAGAISSAFNSELTIYNSVFYGNTQDSGDDIVANSFNANNSNNFGDSYSDLGFTTLTADPFTNSSDFDGADNILGTTDDGLIPAVNSPLIDAGDNSENNLVTDIAGQTRIFNSTIDVGAYEFGATAVAPEITVLGNGIEIANNDTIPEIADDTNFENVAEGSPVTKTFTITNDGQGDLTLTATAPDFINVTGTDFSVSAQPTINVIAAGESVSFDITFTASCGNLGAKTATVSIPNDDSDENPYVFTLAANAEDNEAPVISCPADGTRDTDAGVCSYTIVGSEFDATFTDNCMSSTMTNDLNGTATLAGEVFPLGDTVVTWTVDDGNGQVATCMVTITVEDITPPVAMCQDITVQLDANGNATITAADVDNGSNDACGIASLAIDNDTFDCSDVGANTVTLTVTDNNGNTSTCTATVTVEDNEVPVINCPGNQIENFNASCEFTLPDYTSLVSASDNCLGIQNIVQNPTPGTVVMGNTPVTMSVVDASGNVNTCMFNIIPNDATLPTALCQDITIQLDANGQANITAAQIDNGSFDNCGSVSTSISVSSFDCSNVGANTVTLTVTDGLNSNSCTATVTVVDSISPIITCPADVTIECSDSTNPNDTGAATATDNCDTNPAITFSDVVTPGVGNNETIERTWTATDANGNSSSCTQTIEVLDTTPPSITCPVAITVECDSDTSPIVTGNATAIDNCDPNPIIVFSDVVTPGLGNNETIERTWTATDANGNSSSCTQTIEVVDTTPPTPVCMDITVSLDANGDASITAADVDGGSTDACGIASLAIDNDTFDCSNVGANTVTLTVTDVNGNVSTCTSTVTVEDITPPTALCQDIAVQLDATGNATITAADVDSGSTDACGIASLAIDNDTFDCSNVGANTVTLTVTDVNGNVSTCTSTVTVEDITPPTAICQDITVQLDTNGNATITAVEIDNGSNDACGVVSLAIDNNTFDCSNVGANTVTLTVTDNNGNTASCTATVTVEDNMPPTVTCPADRAVPPTIFGGTYTVPDYFATGEATATDNCSDPLASLTQDPPPGTELPDGEHTVTLCATDAFGNEACCTFILEVDSILGVDVGAGLETVVLYPNPATDVVSLFNPNIVDIGEVAIYDLEGSLIQSINLNGVVSEATFDIGRLAPATYVLVLSNGRNTETRLLIKR